MVVVYSEPQGRRYHADWMSLAFLFSLCIWVAKILLPVFISYATLELWKKEGLYVEQPLVRFKHQIIVQAASSSSVDQITWSSIPLYQQLVGYSYTRQPSLKASSTDSNQDGRPDYINITVSLPKQIQINSVKAMLFFDFILQDRVKMQMEAVAVIQESNPVSLSTLVYQGDLVLRQRNALAVGSTIKRYSTSIFNPYNITSVDSVSFSNLLTLNDARNETAIIDSPNSVWENAGSYYSQSTLIFRIRIPPQPIRYVPGIGEVLKFAVVQYFVLFWILSYLLDIGQAILFKARILDVRLAYDWAPVARPFVG